MPHYEFPDNRKNLTKAHKEKYGQDAFTIAIQWIDVMKPGQCRELARIANESAREQEKPKTAGKGAFTGAKKDNWSYMDARDFCIWLETAIPNWTYDALEPVIKSGSEGYEFLVKCGMEKDYKPPAGRDRKVTPETCQAAVSRIVRGCVNADHFLRDLGLKNGVNCSMVPFPPEEWLAGARAVEAAKEDIGEAEAPQVPAGPMALCDGDATAEATATSSRHVTVRRRAASPLNKGHAEFEPNARSRTAKRVVPQQERTESQNRILQKGTTLFMNSDPTTGKTTFSEVPQNQGQNKQVGLGDNLTIRTKAPPAAAALTKPKALTDMITLWSSADIEPSQLASLIAKHKAKIAAYEKAEKLGLAGGSGSSSSVIALPPPPAKQKRPGVVTVPAGTTINALPATHNNTKPAAGAGASTAPSARSLAAKKREAAKKEAKDDAELGAFLDGEDPEVQLGDEDLQEMSAEVAAQLAGDPDLAADYENNKMEVDEPEAAAPEAGPEDGDFEKDVFNDLDIMGEGKPGQQEEVLEGNIEANDQNAEQEGEEEKGEDNAKPADEMEGLTEEERKLLQRGD